MTEKTKLTIDLSPLNQFFYVQNTNFNFQFLLLDENLKALHTPFQCKDYLQDIFWSEYAGVASGIWGISWKPGMMNVNVSRFKMALMGGTEIMEDRIDQLKGFLHPFEKAQKIPLTKIEPTIDPKVIVLSFSKKWTVNGPMLSAFSTIIRLSGGYPGGDIIEYIKGLLKFKKANPQFGSMADKPFPNFTNPEVHRLDITSVRLAALLLGKKVEHDWKQFKNVQEVHDTGILRYKNFPEVPLE